MGIVKLLTGGLWLLWWIVDIVIIGNSVKTKNQDTLYSFLTGETIKKKVNINTDTIKNVVSNKEVQAAVRTIV